MSLTGAVLTCAEEGQRQLDALQHSPLQEQGLKKKKIYV